MSFNLTECTDQNYTEFLRHSSDNPMILDKITVYIKNKLRHALSYVKSPYKIEEKLSTFAAEIIVKKYPMKSLNAALDYIQDNCESFPDSWREFKFHLENSYTNNSGTSDSEALWLKHLVDVKEENRQVDIIRDNIKKIQGDDYDMALEVITKKWIMYFYGEKLELATYGFNWRLFSKSALLDFAKCDYKMDTFERQIPVYAERFKHQLKRERLQ